MPLAKDGSGDAAARPGLSPSVEPASGLAGCAASIPIAKGRGLAMGGHQSAAMLSDEWLTPPEIIQALGPFDLDPCAPMVRPWDTAAEHYTRADNGLFKPWRGRVWLNPPYSSEAVRWLARMAEHGQGTALTFARTETDWFFETIWPKATALLFLRGRLHFHHVDGRRAKANAGAPSVLAAYGEDDARRLAESGIDGRLVRLASAIDPEGESATPRNGGTPR